LGSFYNKITAKENGSNKSEMSPKLVTPFMGGLAGKRRHGNKTPIKHQLNVTVDS
jgi:hypothetical protein